MADGYEKEDEGGGGGGGGEREGEVLPAGNARNSAVQRFTQVQSVSRDRRVDRADPPPLESPFQLSGMSATLPDVRHDNYQRNPIPRQSRIVAGEGYPSQGHTYAQVPFPPLQPGQGMGPTQGFRPPYQQGRHMQGFQTNYPGGPIAYGHHQSYGHSYLQPLQQVQAQPVAYGHAGTGYYHVQQHFVRQMYDNTTGGVFRQEQNYPTPPPAPGITAVHGAVAAGLAGSALVQSGSTPMSRHSSVSSANSSTLRGPPRKPRQSGYALWCGNLPAQTNIMGLKDHFSRDATDEIESVFLISKSNCAFINYKTEESCTAALARFHDSRFQGAKLVCRLRRGPAAPPAGTPTGPRHILGSSMLGQPARSMDDRSPRDTVEEDVVQVQIMPRKAEEKFFVLKSLTVEDLDASVRNGSWATQSHNEAVLNAAYQSAENVYLVFSANKSGEYYGYARMVSRIDDSVSTTENPRARLNSSSTAPVDNSVTIPTPATGHAPKGYVIDDSARGTIFWEAESDGGTDTKDPEDAAATAEMTESDVEQQSLGHPFRIGWISTEKIPFHRARGLRNPWNQNREVKIARDGTEIEPSVGRRLVNLFHTPQAIASPAGPGPQLLYPARNHPPLYPTAYPSDPRFGRPY